MKKLLLPLLIGVGLVGGCTAYKQTIDPLLQRETNPVPARFPDNLRVESTQSSLRPTRYSLSTQLITESLKIQIRQLLNRSPQATSEPVYYTELADKHLVSGSLQATRYRYGEVYVEDATTGRIHQPAARYEVLLDVIHSFKSDPMGVTPIDDSIFVIRPIRRR